MLRWHKTVHELSPDTNYWICVFANVSVLVEPPAADNLQMQNQHDLSELAASLEESPFWQALCLPECIGMVQIMDKECTPHKRIWCVALLLVLRL